MAGYSKTIVGDKNQTHAWIVNMNPGADEMKRTMNEADLAATVELVINDLVRKDLRFLGSIVQSVRVPDMMGSRVEERVIVLVEPK